MRRLIVTYQKRRNYIKESLVHAKRSGEEVVIITAVNGGIIKETVQFFNQKSLFNGGGLFLTTAIIFEDINGKSVDLIRDYSPKGTFFARVFYNKKVLSVPNSMSEQNEIFFYEDFKPEKIGVRGFVFYNRIKDIGDLLILLHEMGHSSNSGKFYKNNEDLILVASKEEVHKGGRITLQKNEILILYKNITGQKVPTPIPCDDYLIFQLDRAEDERTAWVYAIKSLRKIRGTGVKFESGLKYISDFDELIHSCSLGGYEDRLREEMLLCLKHYEQLQGIFTKKFFRGI